LKIKTVLFFLFLEYPKGTGEKERSKEKKEREKTLLNSLD